MNNVIKFPTPTTTVVDTLNKMSSEELDQVLLSLFETNETLAVDISRGLEIIAFDKAVVEEGLDNA